MPSKRSGVSESDPTQSGLRALAQERLGMRPVEERSAEDKTKLVEELTIHQEELNIQNEELRRIQLELESTKAKYFELYDLAPVGYLTLTPELIIKEANLAASVLLECERNRLIGKGLSRFIVQDSREALFHHYDGVA
jgi:PAS domain-containing protein